MTALRTGLDWLERVLFFVASAALAIIAGVILLQVVMRYVFNNPTSWSDELATVSFVWCVMLAIPLGVRHQDHISMDFLVNKLSGARWRWTRVLLNAVVGATMVAIGVASFGLNNSGLSQLLPGLSMSSGLDIPLLVMYLAVPIGCFASGIYAAEQMVLYARGRIVKPEELDLTAGQGAV